MIKIPGREPKQIPKPDYDLSKTARFLSCLGDFISISGYLSEKERAVERLLLWSKASQPITQLCNRIFPWITVELIEERSYWPQSNIYKVASWAADTVDWTICSLFPQINNGQRKFIGSPIYNQKLADVDIGNSPYWVIQPASVNGANCRNWDFKDWRSCFNFLDRRGQRGIILYKGHNFRMRAHDRITDYSNRFDIFESLELCKNAVGYLGVDSSLACMFGVINNYRYVPSYVKSVNPQYYLNQLCYGGPNCKVKGEFWSMLE